MTAIRPFSTAELNAMSGTLRAALVSDILDGLGLRSQCPTPGLTPMGPGISLIGYAFTVASEVVQTAPAEPYVGLLQALDTISLDDIWVVSSNSQAALWGELTSTASQARGARGAVCDGYVRDAQMVREIGFPVFSRGRSPMDANGRMEIIEPNDATGLGGVKVFRGDLIVADEDGVAVIPAGITEQVVAAALDKSTAESLFRTAVQGGQLPSVAYHRYQVL